MNPAVASFEAAASNIRLRIELSTTGAGSIDTLGPAIGAELDRRVREICRALGIPGQIAVDVVKGSTTGGPESFLKFWVNGSRVRYSRALVSRAHSIATGVLPDPDPSLSPVLRWFEEARVWKPSVAAEFITTVIAGALKEMPSVLFDQAAAIAYAQALEDAAPQSSPMDPVWLRRILAPVLDAGISIGDSQTIASIIIPTQGRQEIELQQELIDTLARPVVQIRAPRNFLRELTADQSARQELALNSARDRLFNDLGLTIPRIAFVSDDSLCDRTFSFGINDLATEPIVALSPERLFVNDDKDHLKLSGIEAQATLHPDARLSASTIVRGEQARVEAIGAITVDTAGHLRLCLENELRSHAGRLVTLRSVRANLDTLQGPWPLTVEMARNEVSDHELTAVLQALAVDGVSIRDVASILERVIDREYTSTPATALLVLDDYPSPPISTRNDNINGLTIFVRSGLRRQISNQHARQTTTVVVYLLDNKMEDVLAGASHGGLSESDEDLILAAIREELAHLPIKAQLPALLTRETLRGILRTVVRHELPQMSVIAHEELASEINVMPVARICLGG